VPDDESVSSASVLLVLLVRKAGLELEALCGCQPAAEILTLNEVKGKDLDRHNIQR